MSQAYSNPTRESDPHALPDIEVWETYVIGCDFCDCTYPEGDGDRDAPCPCSTCEDNPDAILSRTSDNRKGWYWQSCFPGCLPDSEPFGPFTSESEALADAREGVCDDE